MGYDGYTTDLDDLTDEQLVVELARALAECNRGCLDMEGMSARYHAIQAEQEYRFGLDHPQADTLEGGLPF